ncbi:LysR family transcriptional regulator [Caulobacter hibisci]|uniref:LysR family transcriptional regulator n=1 Tax=Caulobacter hibisci TaxID=2035993 RepID=A0ABS0SRF3_9CAUL|nr:LysR family transcriptional regulator [Caulobacter hibisci]MBI1682098.1 LysR family transcriptional regulator [Caulobacter hibisci]
MELRHIRYFLAVAEERNFTRAAARVGIGQPPLSQQIKDLETELGVQLFRRLPGGAELTEAGKAFHAAVRTLPDQAGAAAVLAQRAARGETGVLRLGFTGSASLHPVVSSAVRAYRRLYPEVELSLTESNSTHLSDHLADGALDAAFLRPGSVSLEGLAVHDLVDEPMIAVLPAGHPAAASDPVDLSLLRGEPLIMTPRELGPTVHDAALEAFRASGVEPVLGQPAPQMASVIVLVAAELGVSIVPASMRQLAVEGVAYREIAGQTPVARLSLASAKTPSPALRNFIQVMRPSFRG